MPRDLAHGREHVSIDLAVAALARYQPRQRDDVVDHLPPLGRAIILGHGCRAYKQDQ